MGGVAIIGSTVVGYAVAHVIIAIRGGGGPNASGLLALFLMVGLGAVGFLDDFIKIRRQRSLGLRARAKFVGQLIVARRRSRCWRCSSPTSYGLTPGVDASVLRARHRAIGLGVGRLRRRSPT